MEYKKPLLPCLVECTSSISSTQCVYEDFYQQGLHKGHKITLFDRNASTAAQRLSPEMISDKLSFIVPALLIHGSVPVLWFSFADCWHGSIS